MVAAPPPPSASSKSLLDLDAFDALQGVVNAAEQHNFEEEEAETIRRLHDAEKMAELSKSAHLFFAARDLPNMDVGSLSDAFGKIYSLTDAGAWELIGRTEVIDNCLCPRWCDCFLIPPSFGEDRLIR